MSQQFIKYTLPYGEGTATIYRPMSASVYAAVYVFTVAPKAPEPVAEGELPKLPEPLKSLVFEYAIPRQITRKEYIQAYRKHKVMPSEIITDGEGNPIPKSLKDIFIMEQLVNAMETMTPQVTDPATVLAIETWLDANVAF